MRRHNEDEAEHERRLERILAPATPHESRSRSSGETPTIAAVLAFENKYPTTNGTKWAAMFVTFRYSIVRYVQLLNRMIDTPEALELDPQLVNRLRSARDRKTQQRASRTYRPPTN
ncbi:DUF3263 domain-containing protein [Glaciihabitans sp. dw_435]|uniref:DUF3263 domain-containing protein n=1 Tax=Glaciihabitans sp. dw_435 TaxID=2720081 RepID=UPI001BD53D30|nr:DUF3263 domain-containing protein [Glaciihabitans sp. dw_435]